MKDKPGKITNKGMIKIPAELRKKYNLNTGDKVLVLKDEGALKIIPIRNEEELRKNSYKREDMKKISKEIRKQELASER
jgi:AbrB family looped-hinge helix DNA binding protein